jgi:hypothetical protein
MRLRWSLLFVVVILLAAIRLCTKVRGSEAREGEEDLLGGDFIF